MTKLCVFVFRVLRVTFWRAYALQLDQDFEECRQILLCLLRYGSLAGLGYVKQSASHEADL